MGCGAFNATIGCVGSVSGALGSAMPNRRRHLRIDYKKYRGRS